MNNNQFRKLLLSNTQKKDGSADTPGTPSSSTPARGLATPALGSRKHSSIPMTPRQVRGAPTITSEFARQLAERNGTAADTPQKRKLRATAPKGSRLAAGYIDRTKNRIDEEADETAARIRKLEEALKLEIIDRPTFENMVQEITGGDIAATHLVKGLDRKLLERIKRGEDVLSAADKEKEKAAQDADADVDSEVEAEFDAVAEKEIAPVVREKAEKKGLMAPPASAIGVAAGQKRSRDAILAELKAQRKAAEEAAVREHEMRYPSLGAGFKKIVPGGDNSRIEIDYKGREVLVITDADGKEKRKVRKQKVIEPPPVEEDKVEVPNLVMPPPQNRLPPKEEEEDSDEDDIFPGMGSAYNPLAGLEDGDSDDDSDEEKAGAEAKDTAKAAPEEESGEAEDQDQDQATSNPLRPLESASQPPPPAPTPAAPKPPTIPSTTSSRPPPRRDYFAPIPGTKPASPPKPTTSSADATVLAALAKVRHLDLQSPLLAHSEEARLARRAAELASSRDRDADDMDLGFGASRFDDADDMEREGGGGKEKFSEWRGLGEDDGEEGEEARHEKKKQRTGGGKKKGRKGDKNSVADVLKVMERQKGGPPLG